MKYISDYPRQKDVVSKNTPRNDLLKIRMVEVVVQRLFPATRCHLLHAQRKGICRNPDRLYSLPACTTSPQHVIKTEERMALRIMTGYMVLRDSVKFLCLSEVKL